MRNSRAWPSVASFVLALLLIGQAVNRIPPFPDEDQYAWSAGYFGGRLTRLDFTPGTGSFSDPGWAPDSWWALTQPMGTRLLYGAVLGLAGAATPAIPYAWPDINLHQPAVPEAQWYDVSPQAIASHEVRLLMRIAAAMCAAIGLGCIAWRLGWRATAATGLFLVLPHVVPDLAFGYAEGPLLLGVGLCVLAYGSIWLGPALGLAASFKLLSLPLWLVLLIPGAAGARRWAMLIGVLSGACVWAILDPPSWFGGGPLYLIAMVRDRVAEHGLQDASVGGPLGFFLPSRYLWPAKLAVTIALTFRLQALMRGRRKALQRVHYGGCLDARRP